MLKGLLGPLVVRLLSQLLPTYLELLVLLCFLVIVFAGIPRWRRHDPGGLVLGGLLDRSNSAQCEGFRSSLQQREMGIRQPMAMSSN